MSTDFDKTVGRIAGAIYGDIAARFPEPPLLLIPPVTFKVRKVLERITDVGLLSVDQKRELANEIQLAIIPMLFSFELDADEIAKMAPVIEAAAFGALTDRSAA